MDSFLPTALIIGIDSFVAKKLAQELVAKDITVVGVGDFVFGLGDLDNFKWVADLSEVSGKFTYVFDFVGDLSFWGNKQIEGEKVTFVGVDDKDLVDRVKKNIRKLSLNWRLIEAWGVYGAGMENDNFLADIFESAVRNKNLEIPLSEQKIRPLQVEDLVDVILRASFLSGTEGEEFVVLGKESKVEEMARTLIDKAKMTKMKVFQKEIDVFEDKEEEFLSSQKRLRWKAKIDFKDGIEETLRYFFSEIDGESRNKKKSRISKGKNIKKEVVKREKIIPKIEVLIEDGNNEDDDDWEINNLRSEKNKISKKNEKLEINENKIEAFLKHEENEKKEIVEEETIEEESEEFLDIPKKKLKKEKEDKNKKRQIEKKEKNSFFNKEKRKENRIWFLILFLGLALMILIVPIDWGLNTYLTIRNIKNIPELVGSEKYLKAENLVNKNINKITLIDEKISDWGLNSLSWFRNYQNSLKVMIDLLELESKTIDLVKLADSVSEAIFEAEEIDWEISLDLIEKKLIDLDSKLGVLQARLTGDLSWLPGRWKSEAQKQSSNLTTLRRDLNFGIDLIEVLPEFLGTDSGKKEYLLLFQNESEIRATGGFIGSYGILTFENGHLLDLEVKDIYEADGQLKGHIEPPSEIKNYLGEANWYMRDANWKANFVDSATDIQWFLDKEVNKKVDGVIGLNLASARAILGVTGEIYVADFDEKINKDNLYEQAEFYAETKFFPGSNQKASFLGGLGKQMFEEIKSLDVFGKVKLVGVIFEMLEKNEIQLALNNKLLAKKMAGLGWSGEIYEGECGVENCLMDYLYIVESNLGVNKANYFLYRNIEQVVDISDNLVSRTVKIVYENSSRSNDWPGGDYKNYIRVYLPKEVKLSQVVVMDGIDTTIRKVYNNSDLKIREVDGKKEVGFLMTVPVSKKRIIEIRYSSSISLVNKDSFSYVNYIQKQSGYGETGLVNLVSFPENWQPIEIKPKASLVGGKLLFNQKFDQDIKMVVGLEK